MEKKIAAWPEVNICFILMVYSWFQVLQTDMCDRHTFLFRKQVYNFLKTWPTDMFYEMKKQEGIAMLKTAIDIASSFQTILI